VRKSWPAIAGFEEKKWPPNQAMRATIGKQKGKENGFFSRRAEQVLPGGLVPVGGGGGGKMVKEVEYVQILCTHAYKWKNGTC
jgi:hypothetical protein